MIDYAIDEAISSGIKEIIFVTSSGKESIENYYDRNLELENFLEKQQKDILKELVYKKGTQIEIVTVRQKEQLGLGHAVNCARFVINNEPFAVILADDIIVNKPAATAQLISVYNKFNAPVIGVMEVPKSETNKYGIISGDYVEGEDKTLKLNEMIEKPDPKNAPTNLATPGRYIFTPEIFDYLAKIPRGVGGEYQLTDAINLMAKENSFYAHIYEGDRYDTGSLQGYFRATVDFALRDEGLREYALETIKEYVVKYDS